MTGMACDVDPVAKCSEHHLIWDDELRVAVCDRCGQRLRLSGPPPVLAKLDEFQATELERRERFS